MHKVYMHMDNVSMCVRMSMFVVLGQEMRAVPVNVQSFMHGLDESNSYVDLLI